MVAAGEGSTDAPTCGALGWEQVWYDLQGGVWSRCQEDPDGRYIIDLPGFARFSLDRERDEVTARPHVPLPGESIRDTYWRSVVPLALQALGTEVLHASSVRTERGAIAFCAESRTGKSTLAFLLSQRGHTLWSDDAVPFRSEGQAVRTFQIPFRSRLRPEAVSFIRESGGNVPAPTWLDADSAGDPVPLRAVYVLNRVREPLPSLLDIRQLRGAEALSTLLTHAYCFTLEREDLRQRMVRQYLDLIHSVPVFELRFQSGLEVLARVLDGIERAVGELLARDG